MNDAYFMHERREIMGLLPDHAARIVDVGAGAGHVSAWLRTHYPGAYTMGLEGNADMLGELGLHVDEPHILDLNGPIPELGRPDLILCLDVLEHLLDPDAVLRRLVAPLAQNGMLILSVPNVAHLSVSVPLLLGARFDYADAGILDRTHLHFFVRQSAVALMNRHGLVVHRGIRSGLHNPRTRWADKATLGLLRDRLTRQYIIAGRRAAPGETQGPIAWSLI